MATATRLRQLALPRRLCSSATFRTKLSASRPSLDQLRSIGRYPNSTCTPHKERIRAVKDHLRIEKQKRIRSYKGCHLRNYLQMTG